MDLEADEFSVPLLETGGIEKLPYPVESMEVDVDGEYSEVDADEQNSNGDEFNDSVESRILGVDAKVDIALNTNVALSLFSEL